MVFVSNHHTQSSISNSSINILFKIKSNMGLIKTGLVLAGGYGLIKAASK